MAPHELVDALSPGINAREIEPGLFSVLAEDDRGAPYDRVAVAYDRAVSTDLYLRLAWGITRSANASFIADAFKSDDGGWIIDIAAGSCVDSAALYAETERPTIVIDRSVEMLQRGIERLKKYCGSVPSHIYFLQADANALPLCDDIARTILCHGAYHVFHDTERLTSEFQRVADLSGNIFVSSLVLGRWFGDRYLGLLHGTGEIAVPRTAATFAARLEVELQSPIAFERLGNFAYARARRPTEESQ